MTRSEVWAAIDEHRTRFVAMLGELGEPEWATPSLCPGWTVRDVAGHLTVQGGVSARQAGALVGSLVRARGDVNVLTLEDGRRRASRPTEEILGDLRATIGARSRPPMVTCRESLIDWLVHSQDVAIPLGRSLDLRPAAAAEAGSRIWAMRWPWFPQRRLRGCRLVAADTDWTRGEGAPVEATMGDLLLLLAGRDVVLPRLTGPGADPLTARLA